MGELAKQIERSLKGRAFYLVLEDELDRCWPSEKIKRADREKQIETFAKSHGWIVSFSIPILVLLGQYSRVKAEEPHRSSWVSAARRILFTCR